MRAHALRHRALVLRTKPFGLANLLPLWQMSLHQSGRCLTILLTLMEDAMTHYTDTDNTDGHTLYILVASLLATV